MDQFISHSFHRWPGLGHELLSLPEDRNPGFRIRILGERVHPDTGAYLIYVACEVIAGTARVAAVGELDDVEWVPVGNLGGYVPHGFFEPVEVYLGEVLPLAGDGQRSAWPSRSRCGAGSG